MFRHNTIYSFFIFTLLFLAPVKSLSNASGIEDCVVDGYFVCEPQLCPCPLRLTDIFQMKIFSIICIVFTSVLILGFLMIKELREQPGDFFFGFALGELTLAVTSLIEAIYDENHNSGLDAPEDFCLTVSLIRVFMRRTVRTYHVCYMIFYLVSLRYSLKSSKIPKFLYHIFPWLIGVVLTIIPIYEKSLGRSIEGVCDVKSSSKNSIHIFELVLCALGLLTVPFLMRRLNSRSWNLGPSTRKHLKYYLIYFIFANVILIMTFITKIIGANAMDQFLQTWNWDYLLGVYYSEKAVICIDTASPIFLTILRLFDPFMRQYWKKFFFKIFCCCCRPKPKQQLPEYSINGSPTVYLDADMVQPRLRNLSMNAVEVEASMQNKPFLYQVQQNYKIQVVYTLLASIHYHWKTDKSKMGSFLGPRNDDYYNKKSKVSFKHQITNKIISDSVPEVMDEVRSKNHDILPGRLTVYAPDVFQELMNLDGIGESLIQSLDLGKNYTRILKSGNNQQGGRGGEFFLFSNDNRLIIKTISDQELQVLMGILPRYSRHFENNPKSLIAKIYAVFTFEVQNPYEEYHLILMSNINGYPSSCIARKYDLKGSTVDREELKDTRMTVSKLKYSGTLKDKDFDRYEERLHIEEELQYQLLDTLVKDVAFFRMENLIDYSLAIYLVDKSKLNEVNSNDNLSGSGPGENSRESTSKTSLDGTYNEPQSPVEGSRSNRFSVTHPLASIKSTKEDLYYHLGIIDYLTKYDWKKRFEKFYKQLKALNFELDTSCQDPHTYNRRFLFYMEKIIVESYVKMNETAMQL